MDGPRPGHMHARRAEGWASNRTRRQSLSPPVPETAPKPRRQPPFRLWTAPRSRRHGPIGIRLVDKCGGAAPIVFDASRPACADSRDKSSWGRTRPVLSLCDRPRPQGDARGPGLLAPARRSVAQELRSCPWTSLVREAHAAALRKADVWGARRTCHARGPRSPLAPGLLGATRRAAIPCTLASALFGPNSDSGEFGRRCSDFGPGWPWFGPNLARVRPNSARFGRSRLELPVGLGQLWPDFGSGRIRPNLL